MKKLIVSLFFITSIISCKSTSNCDRYIGEWTGPNWQNISISKSGDSYVVNKHTDSGPYIFTTKCIDNQLIGDGPGGQTTISYLDETNEILFQGNKLHKKN